MMFILPNVWFFNLSGMTDSSQVFEPNKLPQSTKLICLQTEEILAPNYFCGEIKLLLFKVIKVKLTVILC